MWKTVFAVDSLPDHKRRTAVSLAGRFCTFGALRKNNLALIGIVAGIKPHGQTSHPRELKNKHITKLWSILMGKHGHAVFFIKFHKIADNLPL